MICWYESEIKYQVFVMHSWMAWRLFWYFHKL